MGDCVSNFVALLENLNFNFVHPYIKIAIKVMLKQKTKTYEGREQKAVGLNYFSSSSMREFGASSTHH